MLILFLPGVVLSQVYTWDTTIFNNKQKFNVTVHELNEDKLLLITKSNSTEISVDTIWSGFADVQMTDFDNDGNSDILITYMGNNFTYYLFLFDPVTNKFVSVKDFENYPESKPLKSQPHYYYSYHRAGCADMVWVSDLFKIDHFKAIHIGQIYGQGCDTPYYIKAYKVDPADDAKKQLISKIPYNNINNYKDNKWGLIKEYWNKNYLKFK